MNTKRWILLAVMLLFLVACDGEPVEGRPSATPQPEGSPLPSQTPVYTGVTILADGVVQAAQPHLPLGFEIGGKLIELHVEAGDPVQEGDLLAQLEEAETIDSYQAAVTSAELSVLVAGQSLDNLYINAAVRQAEALQAISSAQKTLDALAKDIPIQQSEALQAIADAQEAVRSAQYRLNSLSADASEASVLRLNRMSPWQPNNWNGLKITTPHIAVNQMGISIKPISVRPGRMPKVFMTPRCDA